MNEEPVSEAFEEAFTYFFYLMFSADKIVDPNELRLGNAMIKLEGFDKAKVMENIDFLTQWKRQDIYDKGITALHQCTEKEQLRCLAYMRIIARADGSVADKELLLIEKICQHEVKRDFYDVLNTEKDLTSKIEKVLAQMN